MMAYSAGNALFLVTMLLMNTMAAHADWSCDFETDNCGIIVGTHFWQRVTGQGNNGTGLQTPEGPPPRQESFTIEHDFNSSTGTISFEAYEYNSPPIESELNTSLRISTCMDDTALTNVVPDYYGFMEIKEISYSCGDSSQVEITFIANIWSTSSFIQIDNIMIIEDITTTPSTITTPPTPTTITNPSTAVTNPTTHATNTSTSFAPTNPSPTSQETTSSNSTHPSKTITTTHNPNSNNTGTIPVPSPTNNETSTSDNTTSNKTSTTATATTGTSTEDTSHANTDKDTGSTTRSTRTSSPSSGVTRDPAGANPLLIPVVASVSALIVILIVVFVVIFCNRKRFESKDRQAKADENDASADLYENPAYMDGRGTPGTSGSNGKATAVALSGNIFDEDKLEDNPMYWSQDNEPPQRDLRRNTSVTFKDLSSSPTKSGAGAGYERTIYTMGDQQYCTVDMADVAPPAAPPKTPPRSPLKTLAQTPANDLQEADDLDLYTNPLYAPQGASPSPGGQSATVAVGDDVSLMYAKVDKSPSSGGKITPKEQHVAIDSEMQDNPLYESQDDVPPSNLQEESDPSLQDNPLYIPQEETCPGMPTAVGTSSVGAGVSVKYGKVEPKHKRQSPSGGQGGRQELSQDIDTEDNPLYSPQDQQPVSGTSGRLTNGDPSGNPVNYESIREGTNDEQYTSIADDGGLIASHLYEPAGDELRAVGSFGMYEDLR